MKYLEEITKMILQAKAPKGKARQQILAVLKKGSMSRKEIVKRTGVPRTTAQDNLNWLLAEGKIEKRAVRLGRGRPTILWGLQT